MIQTGFSQNDIKEMKVTQVTGENLIADMGKNHGVMKDAVYDIQRLLSDKIKYIGIAIVTEIEDTTCVLKPYPSGRNKIKTGDFLNLNPTATHSFRQTQNSEFWGNLQKENMKSNDLVLSDGKSYKNARVILTSGKIIKGQTFIMKNTDELLFPSPLRIKPKVVSLKDVEAIQIPTKNYLQHGGLLGVVFTGAIVLIDELKNTPEKESYYKVIYQKDNSGNFHTTVVPAIRKIDNRISSTLRAVIIGGGFVAGSVVGSLIKGGWKTIYPIENKENKISFRISILDNSLKTPVLCVYYRF